jgi:hypothetical protein
VKIAWQKVHSNKIVKKLHGLSNDEELASETLNEKLVYFNVMFEMAKLDTDESINEKSLNKTLLHGQVMVSCEKFNHLYICQLLCKICCILQDIFRFFLPRPVDFVSNIGY